MHSGAPDFGRANFLNFFLRGRGGRRSNANCFGLGTLAVYPNSLALEDKVLGYGAISNGTRGNPMPTGISECQTAALLLGERDGHGSKGWDRPTEAPHEYSYRPFATHRGPQSGRRRVS